VARKLLLIGMLAAALIGAYYLGTRWGIPWADPRPRTSALLYVPPPDSPSHRSASSAAAAESFATADLAWQRTILTRAAGFDGRVLAEKGLADASAGFQRLNWYSAHHGDVREMVEEVENGLTVRVIPGTALIEVGLRLPKSPKDAPLVLRCMVDHYLQGVTEMRAEDAHERRQLLAETRNTYESRYKEQQMRLTVLLSQQQQEQEQQQAERAASPRAPAIAVNLQQQYRIETARDELAAIRRRLDEIDGRLADLDEFVRDASTAIRVVRPVEVPTP
jgi:hypothetical protein